MAIHVQEANGKIHPVVAMCSTVLDIKTKLAADLKISRDSIILIYKCNILDDKEQVKNLKLLASSVIICNIITKKPPVEKSNILLTHSSTDPKNMDELVKSLKDMGFEQNKCETILRKQKYDVAAAANFLLATSTQEENTSDKKSHENTTDNNKNKAHSKENDKVTSQLSVSQYPKKKTNGRDTVAFSQSHRPTTGAKKSTAQHTGAQVKENGPKRTQSSPSNISSMEISETIKKLPPAEQKFIKSCVQNIYHEEAMVLQAFIACEKNQEKTVELLKSFKK